MEKEFSMDVYVLLNIDNEEYLSDGGYTEPSLYHATWWAYKDGAELERTRLDEPNRFMIKKMKMKFEIIENSIKNTDVNFKVLCIDGMVDGVTEGKVYNVLNEFTREDGAFYGIEKDDYGIYNEFRAESFFRVDKIKNSILKNILNS